MLVLSLMEADALFAGAAFSNRRLPRATVLACARHRFHDYAKAGVGLSRFLKGGFTWPELLSIGLTGVSLGRVPGVSLRDTPALDGVWEELSTWTMVDLAMANMTLDDLRYLGVTMSGLRVRGLTVSGLLAMHLMKMEHWAALGLTSQDLRNLRMTTVNYRALGWGYAAMQGTWGLTTVDMSALGFRLAL
jgi:hypothetical protein